MARVTRSKAAPAPTTAKAKAAPKAAAKKETPKTTLFTTKQTESPTKENGRGKKRKSPSEEPAETAANKKSKVDETDKEKSETLVNEPEPASEPVEKDSGKAKEIAEALKKAVPVAESAENAEKTAEKSIEKPTENPTEKTTEKSTTKKADPAPKKAAPSKQIPKSTEPRIEIPGLEHKALAIPSTAWTLKDCPAWAKKWSPSDRLTAARPRKTDLTIPDYDPSITEPGLKRLKKIYAEIDKRGPDQMMPRDVDGYMVLEVIENQLRDYFYELRRVRAQNGEPDLVLLYSIVESVAFWIVNEEDSHYMQCDDGDRVTGFVELIAGMTLDCMLRLKNKGWFKENGPFRSLGLVLGCAVNGCADVAGLSGDTLTGGITSEKEGDVDALDLIKNLAKKEGVRMFEISERGLVPFAEKEDGEKNADDAGEMSWDMVNVDFVHEVLKVVARSNCKDVKEITEKLYNDSSLKYQLDNSGFGGRHYAPSSSRGVWVLCGPGENPNDFI